MFSYRIIVLLVFAACLPGCGSHGPKAKSGPVEVHYIEGATKEEAERVAAYFNGSPNPVPSSYQIKKAGDGYQLRMVTKKESREDANLFPQFELIGARCSREALGGAAVEFHTCDEHLATVKTLPHRPDLRHSLVDNKVEVFYAAPNDKADAEKLAKCFFNDLKVKNGVTVIMKRRDKTVEVHMAFDTAQANDASLMAGFKIDARKIATVVFASAPLELHLCDQNMKSVKVVTP